MRRTTGPFVLGIPDMQRDIDRVFEGLFHGTSNSMKVASATWSPATDVCEAAEYVVVTFELAGIDRNSIDLTFAEDTLIVRGVRRRRMLSEEHSCHRIEIDYGPFERAVHLGGAVNVEEAKAMYEDGLLEVTLPKLRESPQRTVHVNIE